MSLNAAAMLDRSAANCPDRLAVIDGDRRITYAGLAVEAGRFANVLGALGLGRGDRIAALLPNSLLSVTAYFGAFKAGVIIAPLNPMLTSEAIGGILTVLEPKAFICHQAFLEKAAPAVHGCGTCGEILAAGGEQAPGEVSGVPVRSLEEEMGKASEDFETVMTDAGETATVLFTAGTTGTSKGAELSHQYATNCGNYVGTDLFKLNRDDVLLLAAPWFHLFGLTIIASAIYFEATTTILPRFDLEQMLKIMQRDRVTYVAGVPTMYQYLLASPLTGNYDISSLRRAFVGGAPSPPGLMEGFQKRFGTKMFTGYGMTEYVPGTQCEDPLEHPGSVGLPSRGTEIRIVDPEGNALPPGSDGEITLRGPFMFSGYLGQPEETARALRGGWLHTGDVGRLDDEGYLYLTDRLKDMIIRSGYNISPTEIEAALQTHPAVAEAAVIGVPDETRGEEVKAFVVLKPGGELTGEELIEYSKERLAAYKYPRLVEFVDNLPKSSTGKVLKRALRERESS